MLILGLTGKTGAGKSMFCAYLKDRGCYIIDADIYNEQNVVKKCKNKV